MQIAAHDAAFAKAAKIPQSVAKDFNRADVRRDKIARAILKVRQR
jgi:hypothetical protein